MRRGRRRASHRRAGRCGATRCPARGDPASAPTSKTPRPCMRTGSAWRWVRSGFVGAVWTRVCIPNLAVKVCQRHGVGVHHATGFPHQRGVIGVDDDRVVDTAPHPLCGRLVPKFDQAAPQHLPHPNAHGSLLLDDVRFCPDPWPESVPPGIPIATRKCQSLDCGEN